MRAIVVMRAHGLTRALVAALWCAAAACSLEPPADVPDPGDTDAPVADAPDVDAIDAPDGDAIDAPDIDAVDAPDAIDAPDPIDAVDAPDAPPGPTLDSTTIPLRVEVNDTVSITLVISGPPSSTVMWSITSGGGSFSPMSGTAATTGAGIGTITLSYTAPGTAGDRAHTLHLTAGSSTDSPFETQVRTLEGAGELTPFPDNAGINVPPNYLYGQQVFVPRDVVMMKLGFNAQLGGYTGRMALYTNTAGAPGMLVVASALSQVVVGPNDLRVTPTVVTQGTYWLLGNFSSGAAIKRNAAVNVGLAYILHQTGDPLPSPLTGTMSTNNRVMNYHVRFAD